MFGNTNISNTPVSDLLQTGADTYNNAFSNPMNPGNMNAGWGMDPSLMTPSYAAGYRHQYSGSQPYGTYGRPGFFNSMRHLSPTADDTMWGNPFQHQQPYIDSSVNRPTDAGMWAAQRIVAPALAYGLASKAFGGFRGAFGIGSKLGGGIGRGFAGALGASEGSAIAMGAGRVLGAGLGVATGIGLPILGMQALMWGADKTLFNPYINQRRTADSLRNNFSGTTFGDAEGNSVTGGGLGRRESYGMAQDLTRAGINDMSFSTGQYAAGASMVTRAGLTDNVGASGITKRVKESMEQVKLIMSIASMPEMKDAIEQLARLQQAGASVSGGVHSDAAGVMRQMGAMASQAGTSVQRLMNTVGAQGQYLYQANGMTPYLGQLAAANSYSAMAAGNRMGLISSASLARMGGLEGATQASLTGQINVAQTPLNKMANYNQFYNGSGFNNSMIGTVSQFGQSMAADPMGTYGRMLIHGRQMAGNQIQQRGSLAVEDQLMSIARNLPGMTDSKTGRLDFEKAIPLLMQMGMNEDQIQAFATERMNLSDPKVYAQNMKANNRNLAEQQREYISQNGIYGGAIGGTIRSARLLGRSAVNAVSNAVISPITSAVGSVGDSIQRGVDDLWYGSTMGTRGNENVEDLITPDAKVANQKLTRVGRAGMPVGGWNQLVDKSNAFTNELSGITGLSGKFDGLQAVGFAFNVATKVDSGAITEANVDELMKTDMDLQRLSKLTGKTGKDLLDYATKASIGGVKKGLISSGTVATLTDGSKYGSQDDALRAVSKVVSIHNGGLKNADGVSTSEALGYGAIDKNYGISANRAMDQVKQGRLDFTGYKSTMDSLDNGKSTQEFSRAVDQFGRIIDRIDKGAGSPAPKGVGWSNSTLGKWFNGGSDNQKNTNTSAGNPASK